MNANKHARMFRISSSLQIVKVLGKELMNIRQMAKALEFLLVCLLWKAWENSLEKIL